MYPAGSRQEANRLTIDHRPISIRVRIHMGYARDMCKKFTQQFNSINNKDLRNWMKPPDGRQYRFILRWVSRKGFAAGQNNILFF
jgi:hypothetical protein